MKDAGWSIYPNLEKWIWMNCKSISDFAGRIGVAHKTVITLMTVSYTHLTLPTIA